MTFPLVENTTEIETSPEPTVEVSYGNGEIVLVVDDEEEILKAMQKLLDALGYQSAVAASGKEALDKYAAMKPDVVLMDIKMPEMNGLSCAEKIFDLNPDAKIAFLSGYGIESMDEFAGRIKTSPIKTFLTKPVELADLSTALTRMLQE
jgi:YesN/AraC family two-component response regulator